MFYVKEMSWSGKAAFDEEPRSETARQQTKQHLQNSAELHLRAYAWGQLPLLVNLT